MTASPEPAQEVSWTRETLRSDVTGRIRISRGGVFCTIKHDLDSRGYDLDFDSDVGGPYTTLSRVLYTR